MTRQEVVKLREALGLSVNTFAAVVGVHPSTVFRWELAGGQGATNAEPFQRGILAVLARHATRDAGEEIAGALRIGGPMNALFTALKREYER